jgi:hypothetical protein
MDPCSNFVNLFDVNFDGSGDKRFWKSMNQTDLILSILGVTFFCQS